MIIRKTEQADIPAILKVLEAARKFMRQNDNFVQWTQRYPSREDILIDIENGESYCMEQDGEVHATFALLDREEPTYAVIDEGEWKQPFPYGTLHRVASDGVISGVVHQAVLFALQFRSDLRCDTHEVNKPMQRALEREGFVRRGIVYMADGSPRLAYEKNK